MAQAPRRVLAALALIACAATVAAAKPAPRTFRVVIADMAYGPIPAGAHVGDAIEWVNNDILRHSVTARDGSFDVDLAPNTRGRTVLRKAGQLSFYCRYHPGMKGQFSVER